MGKSGFFSSLEGMSKQNTGKDRADQLKQEMKKTQHKQNTTAHLNYCQGSQDVSITKPLQKNWKLVPE